MDLFIGSYYLLFQRAAKGKLGVKSKVKDIQALELLLKLMDGWRRAQQKTHKVNESFPLLHLHLQPPLLSSSPLQVLGMHLTKSFPSITAAARKIAGEEDNLLYLHFMTCSNFFPAFSRVCKDFQVCYALILDFIFLSVYWQSLL